ncbi:cilia- and flagella-associated protein 251 [Pelobates fuscus]|uniref:cilia- and flagella-associated protein 251 n=1 Tax=Pelobates fuscus TaxID=191477 RepID=UPI002FE489DB
MSDSSGDPCETTSRESPHLDVVSQDDQGKAHDMKSMDLNVEQEGNQEVLLSELPETGPKEEQQETTDGVTYRHTPQTSPPQQHEPNESYDTVKDATISENVQYSAAKEVDSESIDINQIVQEEDDTTSVVASETVESYDTVKDTTSTENVQYSVEKEVGNEGIEMNQNVQEEGDSSSVVDSEAVQEAIEQNAEFVLPRGTEQSEAEYPLPRSPEVPDQKEHLELKVKIGESPGVEDVEAEQEAVEEKAIDSLTVRINESIEGGESLVYTATPRTLFEEESFTSSDKPLNLSWSFGMNKNIPVFNLHDEDHQVIVYACAQTAVIHDLLLNRQRHLQAHCTSISCMCVSGDRRWIATADRGPESLIIIWDSFSGIPVHTIFHSHPEGGVIAITMSQNAKYLATVGGGTIQTVSIWDWTTAAVEPICTAELDEEFGTQNYITFNPQDHTQLITNSETQVIFYLWNESGLDYLTPPLNDKTFNKLVGNFSQSVFDFGSVRALTGTSAGKLAIWETIIPKSAKEISTVTPHNKKALKLMHVQKDGITVLTIHDRYFVTGDIRGHVKFYDQRLQLVNWYSDFNLAPIRSISFSKCNPVPATSKTKYPQDCSIEGNQFSISNFIVSTSDALVLHVFTDGTMLKKVLQEPNEPVHALACHPCKPYVAIGSYNGLLKSWNYEDKNFISRIFGKGKHVNCLAYNPSGFHMAAGFTDGSVHILDSVTLEDITQDPFKYARGSITHINYSHNSQYLATADKEFTVTLFKVTSPKDWTAWEYVGRYRSHYKPITSLVFAIELDSYEPRLLSLGMDRMLVEYDLKNSKKDNLLVSSTDRIEQSAVPQYLVWYPPVTKESFMLITNDQYKMKLFNATTKMCRKTLLGPTFGSPVRKMEVLSSHNHGTDKGFLAYITDDKVGLQILPIDGNPHKSMAVICHPGGVSNLACSFDGQYVFTCGGDDCTVMMWKTNLQSTEAIASLGGKDLIPFYGLLEGGRDGQLFKELENYFYYAQLRNQGIDTMETRQVSTHIPLKEVPFIMRALGFYPSEQEVENMLNEVKFSEYVDTGKQVTHINLGDFIQLYINHRPAFGLCMNEIQHAFQVLGFTNEKGEQSISRGELLELLQTRGEHLKEDELAEYLSTLLGVNPEGGGLELENYDYAGSSQILEQGIPEAITVDVFSAEILGLPVFTIENSEEHSETPQKVSV